MTCPDSGVSRQSLFYVFCPLFKESQIAVSVRYEMAMPAAPLPGVYPLEISVVGIDYCDLSVDSDQICVLLMYPNVLRDK